MRYESCIYCLISDSSVKVREKSYSPYCQMCYTLLYEEASSEYKGLITSPQALKMKSYSDTLCDEILNKVQFEKYVESLKK